MKRNMDLARHILFAIEKSADDGSASIHLPTGKYNNLQISLHIRLLKEANLIHAVQSKGLNSTAGWDPHSLTWSGHDFLDAVRDDSIWKRVKEQEAVFGGDLPSETIFKLALAEVNRRVGLADEYQLSIVR